MAALDLIDWNKLGFTHLQCLLWMLEQAGLNYAVAPSGADTVVHVSSTTFKFNGEEFLLGVDSYDDLYCAR